MELSMRLFQARDVAVDGSSLEHHPLDVFELRFQAEPREFLALLKPLVVLHIFVNFRKIDTCLKFGSQVSSIDPVGKIVEPVVLIGRLDDHVVDEQGVFQVGGRHPAVLVKQVPVDHGQGLLVEVAQLSLVQQAFQMPGLFAQLVGPDVHEGGKEPFPSQDHA